MWPGHRPACRMSVVAALTGVASFPLLRTLGGVDTFASAEGSHMSHASHREPTTWEPERPFVDMTMHRDGAQLVLLLHGEADAHTCRRMRTTLMSALVRHPSSVCVDLSDLTFCDLAGSDALHDFAQAAREREIPVDFRGMSPVLAMLYTEFAPLRSHDRRARLTPAEL